MLRLVLPVCALLAACGPPAHHAYFASELRYLRTGVDLEEEARAVRAVLSQRHLSVVAQLSGPGFLALGAESLDGRKSAVRVITERGVVAAEDAAQDDLFTPGSVRLLEALPASLGDYVLVGFARTPAGRDLGCARLVRVLPDGSAAPAVLDVSTLGPRACATDLARGANGRITATLAFPGLFAEETPHFSAELAFQRVPLGQPAPLVPVAKLAASGEWLEVERARVDAALRPEASFASRHAMGVARAAVALLSGLETGRQVAAYREAVGRVIPGTRQGEVVADTLSHIERGWLDASDAPPGAPQAEGATVIEPTPPPGAPGEVLPPDTTVIQPSAAPGAPGDAPATETTVVEPSTPPTDSSEPPPADAVLIEP